MAVINLTVRMVGPSPPTARTTVVLMHGFGAGGDDLVDLSRVIEAAPDVRWLFPEAPIPLDPKGEARAWWIIDTERMMKEPEADHSAEIPEGLGPVRELITGLLDQLEKQDPTQKLVLGGFSQGAMLALDVALHRDKPVAGLVLMSGTRINAAAWKERMDKLRGVPVFMSHGKQDPLLPFAVASSLRDDLAAGGADVDWLEFSGGHEIARPVFDGVSRLIKRAGSGA
jgi:phospholipase/carboxylesterase